MEQTQPLTDAPVTPYNHAVRFGSILGIIAIVLTLLTYALDYTLLADWKVGLFFLILFLGYVIYAGINYRNSIGGVLGYGKAFQHGFIVLAVAGIINTIFNIILHTAIDPDLAQNLTDATVEKTVAMLEGFGMPSDKIDEQVEKMRDEMPERFTFTGQLISYLWALIVYAVVSAITSLFVKKNEPEVI